MINQYATRVFDTAQSAVQTGFVFEDEGMAAVYVRQGDQTVVTASTGVAGEIFAGITQSRNIAPRFAPAILEGVVGEDLKVVLPRLPMADQILVKVDGDVLTVGAGAPADATAAQVSVDEVVFHADAEGQPYFIQFLYELTVTEARTFVGDAPVGGLSSTAQEVIGLFKRGFIATSYFDAAVDWSGAIEVNLGADGMFTVGGTGTKIPNAVVSKAPSAGTPVLVLELR